jgi:hypothetical protein
MNWYLSEYFELLSLLFAMLFYRKVISFKLQPFLLLLFIICAIEICGANSHWFNKPWLNAYKNYILFNIGMLLTMPIHFWIFLNILDFRQYVKTIYIIVAGLVMFFLVINFAFLQGPFEYDVYSLIMTEFIKAVLCLMVITKLFREDTYEISIGINPYFWIAGAILIYSVSAIVLFGLQKFIVINKIQIDGKSIYRVIIPFVNVVLYSSYCYAFYLCSKLALRRKAIIDTD